MLRFDVSRVYKGTVYADQVIVTPARLRGLRPEPRGRLAWVIFANGTIHGDGKAAKLPADHHAVPRQPVHLRTAAGARAGREPPLPGASDRNERAETTDARLTRGLVIAGIGVLGLGAADRHRAGLPLAAQKD